MILCSWTTYERWHRAKVRIANERLQHATRNLELSGEDGDRRASSISISSNAPLLVANEAGDHDYLYPPQKPWHCP